VEKVIKKYKLNDNSQEIDDRLYWQNQSIEFKIEILESLREDAIKLGLYPEQDENQQRFRRVLRVIKKSELRKNKEKSGRKTDLEDLDKLV